jgi:phage I-like protein
MSPYFATENNRIVALRNVALTNMPATRRLEPLMAASRRNHAMSSKLTLQEIATIAKGL